MRESTNHIFRADGIRHDRVIRVDDVVDAAIPSAVPVPTIADLVPVTAVMTRNVTCAARDLSASALAHLMVETRIGCVPVIDEAGQPVGMITKLDLVEQLLASESRAETAYQLMMPITLTLGLHATVAHAAALMAFEDIHHVPIVGDDGVLIGIVSSMDVVRWLAENDGYRTPAAARAGR